MADINVPVRASDGSTKQMRATADGLGQVTPWHQPAVAGAPVSGTNPMPVVYTPSNVGGMTKQAVGTTSTKVLSTRNGRRRLYVQVNGVGNVTLIFGPGEGAQFGDGIILNSNAQALSQGGCHEEPGHDVWFGEVWAVGDAASTVTIVEG